MAVPSPGPPPGPWYRDLPQVPGVGTFPQVPAWRPTRSGSPRPPALKPSSPVTKSEPPARYPSWPPGAFASAPSPAWRRSWRKGWRLLSSRYRPWGPPGRIERARVPQGYNGCGSVAHRATTVMGVGTTGPQRRGRRGSPGSEQTGRGVRGTGRSRGLSRRGPVASTGCTRGSDGSRGCMTRVTWMLRRVRLRLGADLGEWRGGSHPGPFEGRIFWLCFDSELVVGPGSDTVLTQRRSDPADRPGATRDWHADVAQLVEHHLAKVRVAGSNPVVRSEARLCGRLAAGQPRSYGGVAEWLRQGPAKPCTRVRFPSPPPPIS